MFEDHFEEDEVIDIALGKNGEQVNFDGYTVVLAHQDEPDSVKDMMDEIRAKPDSKGFVKMGFFDSVDLEKLLSQMNIKQEFENNKSA